MIYPRFDLFHLNGELCVRTSHIDRESTQQSEGPDTHRVGRHPLNAGPDPPARTRNMA
jgi:hypothetical protein